MKTEILQILTLLVFLKSHLAEGSSCFVSSWKDGDPTEARSQEECSEDKNACFISRIVTVGKDGEPNARYFGQCIKNIVCPAMTCDRLISRASDAAEITECDMTCCQDHLCNTHEEHFSGFTPTEFPQAEVSKQEHDCYTGSWTIGDVSGRREEICEESHCIISRTVSTSNSGSLLVSYVGLCVSQKLCMLDPCQLVRQNYEDIEQLKSCDTLCCSEHLCNDPDEVFPEIEEEGEEEVDAHLEVENSGGVEVEKEVRNQVSEEEEEEFVRVEGKFEENRKPINSVFMPCTPKKLSHDQCCGEKSYNSAKTGCCSGVRFRFNTSGCCNGEKYSKKIKVCNNGRVYKKKELEITE